MRCAPLALFITLFKDGAYLIFMVCGKRVQFPHEYVDRYERLPNYNTRRRAKEQVKLNLHFIVVQKWCQVKTRYLGEL